MKKEVIKKDRAATYKEAGVDIDAGNALVGRIKPLAKATRKISSASLPRPEATTLGASFSVSG